MFPIIARLKVVGASRSTGDCAGIAVVRGLVHTRSRSHVREFDIWSAYALLCGVTLKNLQAQCRV